jgi:hypothetical protein
MNHDTPKDVFNDNKGKTKEVFARDLKFKSEIGLIDKKVLYILSSFSDVILYLLSFSFLIFGNSWSKIANLLKILVIKKINYF